MAETSPYTFSSFIEHSLFDCREFMTFSVSKKPLEQRQEATTSMGKMCPDKIPVVIKDIRDGTKQKITLVVEANSRIGDLFTTVVKQIYQFVDTCNVKYWDPTAEKLMSSIDDEYKDEDDCLYMTLTGYFRRLPKTNFCPSSTKTRKQLKEKRILKDLDAALAEKKRKFIDLVVDIQSMEEKLQKIRRKVTENEGVRPADSKSSV